mgnify:CR=1 FL=1
MKVYIYLVLITFFVSCSDNNWTKEERNSFVHSCREEGGSKEYCECYMSNVMTEYPIASDAEIIDFEVKIELSKNCK